MSFPTVVFSFLLVVVVGYWLIVITGVVELDDDAAWLGLGGVPAGVTLSLLIALAWLLCLIGSQVASGGPLLAVPFAAAGGAWLAVRGLIGPLRRLFPEGDRHSRGDLIGRPCVIRTGSASPEFGQAEVSAADGSTAVVQVRTTGADRLARGDKALIFEYDKDGEFFWVMPYESEI
ncbi:YqiJ family protein [Actinomadura sp. ATCC 31491]|uniref:YqiJ family protein n=1 Tax=Actinomadura luzonensis TaxID=2805427 RepID=A0ABT0FP44_9ACTN|nr:YqiJ family protein [Actinomadura luzonensis]MCK2214119.1 YqiJ family protein [Actinomadura luzonensis]